MLCQKGSRKGDEQKGSASVKECIMTTTFLQLGSRRVNLSQALYVDFEQSGETKKCIIFFPVYLGSGKKGEPKLHTIELFGQNAQRLAALLHYSWSSPSDGKRRVTALAPSQARAAS
jgi:hypothetical protein